MKDLLLMLADSMPKQLVIKMIADAAKNAVEKPSDGATDKMESAIHLYMAKNAIEQKGSVEAVMADFEKIHEIANQANEAKDAADEMMGKG